MKFLTVEELDQKIRSLVKSERKITHEILEHIQLMDKTSGYLKLNYKSMKDYLIKGCGYGEDAAYRRLSASKLLCNSSEISEKIKSGSINLSQASKISKALQIKEASTKTKLSDEQKKEIISEVVSKIENQTLFTTESIIAKELDIPVKRQSKIIPQRDDSVRLEITRSKEQYEKLNLVKSLLSHKAYDQDLARILELLCDEVIEKSQVSERLEKKFSQMEKKSTEAEKQSAGMEYESEGGASRNKDKSSEIKKQNAGANEAGNPNSLRDKKTCVNDQGSEKRKSLNVNIKKYLLKKAQHQCEFVHADGSQCNSQYQLQIDHKIPRALGGTNDLHNLRVLCREHNLSEARRFGIFEYQ